MTTTRSFRSILAIFSIAGATQAAAQTDAPAQPWRAFLGCWAPVIADSATAAANGTLIPKICVTPAGESAVTISTLSGGNVVDRTTLDVTGEKIPSSRQGCTGWEQAQWAKTGQRVYLRSEHTCEGGIARHATAILQMGGNYWLDVRRVATTGSTGLIRAVRYVPWTNMKEVPADIVTRLPTGLGMSIGASRLSAAAPLTISDVIDATRHVDAQVVEAWIAERGTGFEMDDKKLLTLADAKVPSSVIDVMVALSYPRTFAIDHTDFTGLRAQPAAAAVGQAPAMYDRSYYDFMWDDPYYTLYGSRYGYNRYYNQNPYYRNGYYAGNNPVVIVVTDPRITNPLSSETRNPKVVKGSGYTEGRSSPSTSSKTSGSSSSGSSSSGSSSSGSSSSGSSSSSSSGSGSSSSSGGDTGRTAKARGGGGGN